MANSTLDEPKLPGGYLVTPRVPQGLAAAVEGLTREVIRNSPEDIYVFAAHHFEKLLLLREKCGGVEKSPDRDGNLRILREMGQALRMREIDRGNARSSRNTIDQVGWSLSQTAKVLKRHRSIFGDEGRRITTDEVFRMANPKENPTISSKASEKRVENRGKRSNREKSLNDSPNELWKASTSRTERSWSNEDSAENNEVNSDKTRTGPRIITQIPNLPCGTGMLARDIKTELRKNRISSRERSNVRAKPEERSLLEKSDSKIAKSGSKNISSKKPSDRQKRLEPEVEQKRSRKSHDTTRSSKERQHDRRSMRDDVTKNREENLGRANTEITKDFQRFATTRSLEELQTANYVEKVQEIIDETGPIIKEKIEELKSGMIGRSKRSSWFENAQNNRARGSNDALNEKSESAESTKNLAENRDSRVSSTDALRTRLTETQELLENVSSSLTRSKRRSRSARNSRMRENIERGFPETLTISKDSHEDVSSSESSNRGNGLETRLSKTCNLLEDISSTLSRPIKRSSSAKSLRKSRGTMEEFGETINKDILKKRLDETRNLLKGISASFARQNERVRSTKRSRNRANIETEEMSYSDGQIMSKVSLPAVRSISMKNSSGSVSRSESDNLVLPAISPEVPRSAKIREDLILPVLSSPPGTMSTNEDSKRINETNDDVLLEDIDIPEIPTEDCIPEVVDNVSRDSLNVTPDFDSIPQRPDSLEPEEIIDDLEVKISEVHDLEVGTSEVNDLEEELAGVHEPESKTSDLDGLAVEASEVDELERKSAEVNNLEDKSSGVNDLETKVEEIQKAESNIEEIFDAKSTFIDPASIEESENSMMRDKLRELEEAEKRIDKILGKEICKGSKDSPDSEKYADESVEITDKSGDSSKNVDEELSEKIESKSDDVGETQGNEELQIDEREVEKLTTVSPEPLNYTYVLSEGSPYDIPDTVTTVIIPERNVESPLSDRLNIELEDGQEAKLSLISGSETRNRSIKEIQDVEGGDENYETMNIVDNETIKDSHDSDEKSPKDDIEEELKITEDTKNVEDTVTTVIISERNVESPLSDRLNIELEDGQEAKLSLISGSETRNRSIQEIQDVEGEDENYEKMNIVDNETMKDSHDSDEKSPKNDIEEELKITEDTKNVEESTENDSSPKIVSDPFGEFIKPESVEENLTDIEFIREIENRQDIPMARQDLGRINEEMSEELEDLEEPDQISKVVKNVGKIEETKEETLDIKDDRIIEEDRKEDDEKINVDDVEVEKIITESDLSPEATRPYMDSESSNEAKESSAADEPLDSAKCGNSLEDEEISDPRTPDESSNEVKETTLTDGLSFSLDPTRPFVPELNLDSLQDITVSSFKMTEDEYENQEPVQSGNTISITETLTSDENHRITDNGEFVDEAIMEFLVSESARSSVEEKNEDDRMGQEVVEEIIVKSQVEVKEDICEKTSSYVTGPSTQEEEIICDEAELPVEEKTPLGEKEEEGNVEVADVERSLVLQADVILGKEEENTKEEKEETAETEVATEQENVDILQAEEIEEKNKSEEMEEAKPESLSEHEEIEIEEVMEKNEDEAKADGESASSEFQQKEEIENNLEKIESPDKIMIKDSGNDDYIDERLTDEFNNSGDLNDQMQTGEEESDDIVEESYDDTPLAVSRSASQCTTRRVSSGNLARLREDPILGWTEEVGQEDDDNEDDPTSSKVKFAVIGDEMINEQDSNEMDHGQNSDKTKEINNESPTKDSNEYHIYVPEVDAGEDYSTTESSTFDSAVTKIQAGVRGFLTRRRLQRGQHNRSSTLTSIPSIQDSLATEPYCTTEREPEEEEEKHRRMEKIRLSSSKISEDNGFVDAATRIQSNYRGYKERKRLRREDAIHRTTLSLEKSFAENGLQHTGEFHDCIPLPINDITLKNKTSPSPKDSSETILTPPEVDENNEFTSKIVTKNPYKNSDEVASIESLQRIDGDQEDDEEMAKSSLPFNSGKMFFGQSSNVPILQFGVNPNVSELVDLVVVGKEDAELQSGYLNFITSVEDTERIVATTGTPLNMKDFHEDEKNSNESLKEPLALSGPPVGVTIEEVTSSGAENFMKTDDENDRTMASTGSSLMVPEVIEKSITSPRAPCASSETISMSIEGHQADSDCFNRPEVGEMDTESSAITDEVEEHLEEPEQRSDLAATDERTKLSSNGEKTVENIAVETESMTEDFPMPEILTSIEETKLLAPESSVDSMKLPEARPDDKNNSDSLDSSTGTKIADEEIKDQKKNLSHRSEIIEEGTEGESIASNVDEASSMLSFSMKIEDLLDVGSEDAIKVHSRKPILEVTMKPIDLMKSMSLSQESQLAGERIESPITMIQIAPERSESLQQDELSENDGSHETNGKAVDSPSSEKLKKK